MIVQVKLFFGPDQYEVTSDHESDGSIKNMLVGATAIGNNFAKVLEQAAPDFNHRFRSRWLSCAGSAVLNGFAWEKPAHVEPDNSLDVINAPMSHVLRRMSGRLT